MIKIKTYRSDYYPDGSFLVRPDFCPDLPIQGRLRGRSQLSGNHFTCVAVREGKVIAHCHHLSPPSSGAINKLGIASGKDIVWCSADDDHGIAGIMVVEELP